MGGLDTAGIYTDLASFDRVVLDGLQGLYPLGSDPVSQSGPKDHRYSAKNDIGFHSSPERGRTFRGHPKSAGAGDELHLWLVYQ